MSHYSKCCTPPQNQAVNVTPHGGTEGPIAYGLQFGANPTAMTVYEEIGGQVPSLVTLTVAKTLQRWISNEGVCGHEQASDPYGPWSVPGSPRRCGPVDRLSIFSSGLPIAGLPK